MFLHGKPINSLAARELNHIFRGKADFCGCGKVMSTGCDCGKNNCMPWVWRWPVKRVVEDEEDTFIALI